MEGGVGSSPPSSGTRPVKLVINTGRAVATVAREFGHQRGDLGAVGARVQVPPRRRRRGAEQDRAGRAGAAARENSELKVDQAFLNYASIRMLPWVRVERLNEQHAVPA
jgi:hypothetical protein